MQYAALVLSLLVQFASATAEEPAAPPYPPPAPPPPSLGFVVAFVVVGLTAVLFLIPLLFIMCCPQCFKSCKSAEQIQNAEDKRHEAQDKENQRHPVIYGSAV